MGDLTRFMGMEKKWRDISMCSWGTLNPVHKKAFVTERTAGGAGDAAGETSAQQ